jgi:hypothetical protein
MLEREMSVVEIDQLFKNINGFERVGSACQIFTESCNIHFPVEGWIHTVESNYCQTILRGNMAITVGLVSNSFSIQFIPGIRGYNQI